MDNFFSSNETIETGIGLFLRFFFFRSFLSTNETTLDVKNVLFVTQRQKRYCLVGCSSFSRRFLDELYNRTSPYLKKEEHLIEEFEGRIKLKE
jgi:Mg2+ and Co2+ transporter CorA